MKKTEVTDTLNALIADFHVLTVKLHNYHWNVGGMDFHAVHLKTEEYYNYFFLQFDDIAERILQLGAKPLATAAGLLETSTIEEETGNAFEGKYVFEKVLSDFETLHTRVVSASELADEAGDTGTVDLLSGIVGWFEKEIWMLKAAIGS